MQLPAIDPQKLLFEPVECRLAYSKYSEDPEILRVLCEDPFWFVRDYVASNHHTPEDCLQKLLADPDFRISTEAKRNLNKRGISPLKPSLTQQLQSAEARQSTTSVLNDLAVTEPVL